MNPQELIIIHETNTLARALEILKNGIRPSAETGEVNWFQDRDICLLGFDFESICDTILIWGHICFVISETWVTTNAKGHFKMHGVPDLGGKNTQRLWSLFMEKHDIQDYMGPINTAHNQLICDIPIPLEAIECVILQSHDDIDLREKELIRKNLPSHITFFVNEKNKRKLIKVK